MTTGVAEDRLTVVQNAGDTSAIYESRESITDQKLDSLWSKLGIDGGPAEIYLGSLYTTKRLACLIKGTDRIRDQLPDFELIVIGGGPGRATVDDAGTKRPWTHSMGRLMGGEMLHRAALGLVIMNSGLGSDFRSSTASLSTFQ